MLNSVKFSSNDILEMINNIYDNFKERIEEYMIVNNNQYIFAPKPYSCDGEGNINQDVIGKTISPNEGDEISVHLFYEKLTCTLNSIFHNSFEKEAALTICNLYIEFLLAHELAHVSKLVNCRQYYLDEREKEKVKPEAKRSYEIEADKCAKSYMQNFYNEIGELIGDLGREIHKRSSNYAHDLIIKIIETIKEDKV